MKPFLTFNLFLLFIVAVSANAVCPDLKKNETKADCPWAAITRKILEPKNTCEDVLKSKLSYIVKQIERDKKSSEFSSLWGQAKNFDENAKAVIVDPKILNYLAKKLNLESSIQTHAGFDSVHAGLQHTYAYLFSQLETPYGYKRARWVTGEIEQGFGLSPKTFNPETNKGSFLANVTYFFAMFAFKEDVQFLQDLQKQGQKNKSVSAELIQLKSGDFQITNLVESFSDQSVVMHTTFVKMNPEKKNSKNSHLLIYWVEDKANKTKLLITGFPVETSFVDRVLDEKNLGSKKIITTHYNAWISGITDSQVSLTGTREKISGADTKLKDTN